MSILFRWKKNMTPEEERLEMRVVMCCLGIVSACCILISILENARICYRLGVDNTEDFIWQVLPGGLTLVAMLCCASFIGALVWNALYRRQVFVRANAQLITWLGFILCVLGLILGILNMILEAKELPANPYSGTHLIYVLLGTFVSFIACVFKMGVRMKEEQDLTV